MSEVPAIWLWISGLFFVVNILFFLAMAYVMLFVVAPFIRDLNPKLQTLTDRVDTIGHKVEELAETARSSVEMFGGRAQSVATSVDTIAHTASRQFEKFSPFFVGALTAIRLVKALNEVRKGRGLAKATTKDVLDRNGKNNARNRKVKLDKRTRA